jgi:hypothetical protein
MQRWQFLWATEDSSKVELRFTHEQPSNPSVFPCAEGSNGLYVKIEKNSREDRDWSGPWWLAQLADDGWELVSATTVSVVPGMFSGRSSIMRDLFFKRPVE